MPAVLSRWPALLMTAAGMLAAVVNGLVPEEKTEEEAVAN